MKIANCLIVDDGAIARNIIKSYCVHLPALNVVAECGNALDAKKILQEQEIDIIFLDIQMPVLDGLNFTKTLKYPPQIIFTTAYKEYAVDAFDLAACDYLLKPFSFERFIVAVDKALERLLVFPKNQKQSDSVANDEAFFIKTEGKIFKIKYSEFIYAEASGNRTKVVCSNMTILPTMTFDSLEKLLPTSLFARIHRSFIINSSKISRIEGNRVFIDKNELPIGSNYKESLMKSLGL